MKIGKIFKTLFTTLILAVVVLFSIHSYNLNKSNESFSFLNLKLLKVNAECDLCEVTNPQGKVVFSCQYAEKKKCEVTKFGYILSCDDAEACK